MNVIEAKVPCDGCRLCCYGPVMLHPALGDEPERYTTKTVEGVGVMLARKRDGACIYLQENGCGKYNERPALCRAFDCRAYAYSAARRSDPLMDGAIVRRGRELAAQRKCSGG